MSALSYTLLVNGSVYGSQSAYSAYNFACALLEEGHSLKKVFFYQDGVLNGSRLVVPANDEFNLSLAWSNLAKEHNVALETCVAASLRRGIIGKEEAKLHELDSHNLAPEFEQAGLGSLAESLVSSDRVVQF
ncbi:sulfurtransferase complex subunit TusD [Vibrio sp.]|uniref:Sulfurtransferase TusD homolog n=1 Tax=Vibrio viridaestus TaxID=2487322 RepID=A0A3N9TW71_9VIBR|nr:sulfurtransferase complex subunit TusD [Vibrio viridaestus]MDC0612299.1 sulfurtransferase complex subunit TusD [Vibrio sp.]RQW61152.1 sulfurtransferase complex subunit TusD [Vibrio viridaestus]